MPNHLIKINNPEMLNQKAEEFLKICNNFRIMAFYGEMGIGKTTFIKALCKQLQVVDDVTSPTFAIVNEYNTSVDLKVYHFDFYRIKKADEIYDFGYEEYLFSNNYCLIEWPELAEDFLPDNTLRIYLTKEDNGSRNLRFDI